MNQATFYAIQNIAACLFDPRQDRSRQASSVLGALLITMARKGLLIAQDIDQIAAEGQQLLAGSPGDAHALFLHHLQRALIDTQAYRGERKVPRYPDPVAHPQAGDRSELLVWPAATPQPYEPGIRWDPPLAPGAPGPGRCVDVPAAPVQSSQGSHRDPPTPSCDAPNPSSIDSGGFSGD